MSINAEGAYERWSSAVGNIEDAKVAVDIMARAIEDAVYLDEDAYNQMIPMQQYTRTIEVSFPCYPHTELYPFRPQPGCKASRLHHLLYGLAMATLPVVQCLHSVGNHRGNDHVQCSQPISQCSEPCQVAAKIL